ncbi:hypothetical protein FRB93_007782 [Tulasnella sp. JGI-2019a]|nr:hypothetical protein FRB93_007782 [Tulasnella sp. JGI-2019a]
MGGAVAVLNAMYLRLHLPPSTPVSSFTVGTPKIGNAAFAAWSDKVLAPVAINSVRIVNAHDIVPTLPLPRVEYHLQPNGRWYNCGSPSHYRTDSRCSDGYSEAHGSLDNHSNLGELSMIYGCAAT